MLLAIEPLPFIDSEIRPLEGTKAFFLVKLVVAHVTTSIRPSEGTKSMHLIVEPLTHIDSAI